MRLISSYASTVLLVLKNPEVLYQQLQTCTFKKSFKSNWISSTTDVISTNMYNDNIKILSHNLRSNYEFFYKKCKRLLES